MGYFLLVKVQCKITFLPLMQGSDLYYVKLLNRFAPGPDNCEIALEAIVLLGTGLLDRQLQPKSSRNISL